MATPRKPTWHYWHRTLLAIGRSPITYRREEIRESKPQHERKTRLRLLKYVRGRLPKDVLQVLQAQAGFGVNTDRGISRLPTASRKAIIRLHKKECPDCPWDGRTIFPEEVLE